MTDIFNESKYTKWYFSIVTRALLRIVPEQGYHERHHIIPRSMGGNNGKANIVSLTAREHFVCHRLLTKMTSGENLMRAWSALRAMSVMDPHGGRLSQIRVTSRMFEHLRAHHALRIGDLCRARWQDPEFREKMRTCMTTEQRQEAAQKANTPEVNERKRASAIGRLHSEETKAKMRATRIERYGSKKPKREGPRWIVTSPTGSIFEVNVLEAFCEEHSLHAPTLVLTVKTKCPVPERPRNRAQKISDLRTNTTGWMVQKRFSSCIL